MTTALPASPTDASAESTTRLPSRSGQLQRFVVESTTDAVCSDVPNSAITVRHAREGSWLDQWGSHGT